MIADILISLAISLVLTLIFPVGIRGLRTLLMIRFFIVLFLFTWAGGIWIVPFGPIVLHRAWIPLVIAGWVGALLLTAVLPTRTETGPRGSLERGWFPGFSLIDPIYWILVLTLLAAAFARYTFSSPMWYHPL